MDDSTIRRHLITLLRGEGAHATVERALAGLPAELRGVRPQGLEHSVWELLDHMRLGQEDILRYATDPDWRSPAWPEGYWPADPQPPAGAWDATLAGFGDDLEALIDLVRDEHNDLTAALGHAPRHTLLREVLLVADHNAYHAGQIVDVRRALGAWPPA
jgi:uncharacterized damage-inducible protein DinB